MWQRIGVFTLFVLIIISSQVIAADELENRDILEQEDSRYEFDELDLLSSYELLDFLIENPQNLDRWLAVASIIGWGALIASIILCPPVGVAAALLAVLGLNIASLFMAIGLGTLFGVL